MAQRSNSAKSVLAPEEWRELVPKLIVLVRGGREKEQADHSPQAARLPAALLLPELASPALGIERLGSSSALQMN